MMEFENNIKEIKKIYSLISGKESDVHITFRGGLGISLCWNLRIDNREVSTASLEDGSQQLLVKLKEELAVMIRQLENQAQALRKALGNVAS